MNNKQQPVSKLPLKVASSPTQATKSQQFMKHFNSLHASALKTSTTTPNTSRVDYSRIIEQYSHKESHIDSVTSIFNNPQICDLFGQPIPFVCSQTHLGLTSRAIASVGQVVCFFSNNAAFQSESEDFSFLNMENYSRYLASSKALAPELQEKTLKNSQHQQIKSQLINVRPNLNDQAPIASKVDLLLAEIAALKKRSKQHFYHDSLTIKLTQLVDYLTQDDQRYIGLSLQQKAKEISTKLKEYQGKTSDGYLTLPLLQYFFSQLRELEAAKLQRLKSAKLVNLRQKQETQSELSKQSSNSQKSQGGKYSQRKRHPKQQEWIGKQI